MPGASLVVLPAIWAANRCSYAQVSMACCDLLGQLLTPEPDQRITLSRIMRHPWFVRDAPPGLLDLNSRLLSKERSRCAVGSVPLITVHHGPVPVFFFSNFFLFFF